jgi:hypothetical protein
VAAPPVHAGLSNDLDLPVTTVHVEFHARDVGRILRSEEGHGAGNLLRLSKPLHGNPGKHILREFIERFLGQSVTGPAKAARRR